MINLVGKNALITGSSRGIGQQIALGLAEKGCNIIVHGRTEESCNITLNLLEQYSIKTYCVFGDLSEETQINSIIDQVNTLQIPIDILYNNAAIMTDYRHDIWSHTFEDWLNSYKINVIAMYKLCSAFIPKMIENDFGRVVNITSGITDQPQLAPYGSSKWAVNKLSKDIAVTLENTNVRLNYLDPTWLQTDMGGEYADNPVEAVLPGALTPALIENDGPNGQLFLAIE